MSQNSLVLPTSGTLSGLAAVEGINAALDTLNTLNSGASAPSAPETGQLWHDTANNLLKCRSQDNTAWITIGALDETNHVFAASTRAQPNLYGLILSNDASSSATVLDIAPGGANDSTGTVYMRLAAATKKNVTAAWAAGSGNGSLDTGTFQASKGYHVHLITNGSTGAVDILTSLSFTNPVLPSGYTNFVAIGAIYSNASSQITPFVQNGNEFLYQTPFPDLSAATSSSVAAYLTHTIPLGVQLHALFRASIQCSTGGNQSLDTIFFSPDESGIASVNATSASLAVLTPSVGVTVISNGDFSIRTNTSGQTKILSNATLSASSIFVNTRGFVYPRGLQ